MLLKIKHCKNCSKWIFPEHHANGVFGKCTKNNYWCNENYNCVNEVKHDKSEEIK